jgi:hypothetical protein
MVKNLPADRALRVKVSASRIFDSLEVFEDIDHVCLRRVEGFDPIATMKVTSVKYFTFSNQPTLNHKYHCGGLNVGIGIK